MNDLGKAMLGIFTGILALSIVSVIVSKRAQTPTVIQAAGTALSNVIAAAVNPVTNSQNNGFLGNNTFTTPALGGGNFNSFQTLQGLVMPSPTGPLTTPNFGSGYL